jgi:hypothetical protein
MKNLFKNLAGFQNECPAINKNIKGYSYKYADLPQVLEVIKPLLAKYNLGFTQLVESVENNVGVKTILFETQSGESIETTIFAEIPDFKGITKIQSLGSIITYLRRYSLSAILGIVTDEDNDGNHTQPANNSNSIPFISTENFSKIISSKNLQTIEKYLSDNKGKIQFTKEQQLELTNHINTLKS